MTKPYRFLPFRFERKNDKVLLVNDVGDYYFLGDKKFQEFTKRKLNAKDEDFLNLQSKYMMYCDNLPQTLNLLATRYRTKKQFLYDFTSLHMFVVTQRCNQNCTYCHASSVDDNSSKSFDMNSKTAKKCVDLAFASPSPHIKIEFQGGEPLLNFEIVKEIVSYANELNKDKQKELEFVICTNLTKITSTQIEYLKKNDICVSTSLDGPYDIHNSFRQTRNQDGTYDIVCKHLSWVMEELGKDKISALMTVTPSNLYRLREVIDEYINQGLSSVFLRMINPYGSAIKSWTNVGYSVEEYINSYKDALEYIIQLNRDGEFFVEEFASLLLTKILTPFSTGFVDLQSPTGAGIGGAIYEVNGDVYIADEARMLAKINNDKTFCIGNVHDDSWQSMFCGDQLSKIIKDSCIEATPGCAWCVYQPYCGCDPIRNYIQFGSCAGKNSKSDLCHKNRAIFNIIFDYLEKGDEDIENIFWSWITRRHLSEINI